MTVISEKESEEWYQISKKEFRAWLESKGENVVVGQSICYGNDPIATAINEKDRLVLRATELLPCLYGLTWEDLSDREWFQFKKYRFQIHILAENTEDRDLRDKVQSIFWRYSSYDY